jgi:RNA polymerase sigma-70 factor (ECF subfamily)
VNSEKICEKALAELAEGNTEALSAIYGEMSRRIFSLAYTVTGNYCDAEDVLQNTMIDITRYCRGYSGGSIGAWIMTIARNNALDVVRKRHNGTEPELFEDGASELMEVDAFAAVEIMDMLSVLDEEEKQIVLLRLYQEMPYREIAEVMGIKIFAAQKRYQRAISKLKKYNPR